MNEQMIESYFERIGLDRPEKLNLRALVQIQQAHLAAIPFENLDIISGKTPLALDEDSLFDKIVTRKRGGICYEQNLLYAAVLRELGATVHLKAGSHPKYGDTFDHAFLMAELPDEPGSKTFITDVGLLLNFHAPLIYEVGCIQFDMWNEYRIEPLSEDEPEILRLMQIKNDHESELFSWKPGEYTPADYRTRCDWYASSPESRFTRGLLLCIDAEEGRTMLSHDRLTWTESDKLHERTLSKDEIPEAARNIFGLEI